MRVSQHKYIGKVTGCVLGPYNDRIRFQQYNYCFDCKLLHDKGILKCRECKNRLSIDPKEYIICLKCHGKLFPRRKHNRDADLFVSRNNSRGAITKHYCVKCALQCNYISSDVLHDYLARRYLPTMQIYLDIVNKCLDELKTTGRQPNWSRLCH